jgi:hypothetical protein
MDFISFWGDFDAFLVKKLGLYRKQMMATQVFNLG